MTDRHARQACDLGADGAPTCSTGPLGRLGWTLHELADLFGLRRRDRDAR